MALLELTNPTGVESNTLQQLDTVS